MDAPSIKVTYEEYLAGKHSDVRNDNFKSYNTIFTNFEYSNNKIFFIFKNPLNIKVKDNLTSIKKIELNNINMKTNLNIDNVKLKVSILNKLSSKGMFVNIKYKSNIYLSNTDLKKIAMKVEATFLGINLDQDKTMTFRDNQCDTLDNSDFAETTEETVYDDFDYSEEDEVKELSLINDDNYEKNVELIDIK